MVRSLRRGDQLFCCRRHGYGHGHDRLGGHDREGREAWACRSVNGAQTATAKGCELAVQARCEDATQPVPEPRRDVRAVPLHTLVHGHPTLPYAASRTVASCAWQQLIHTRACHENQSVNSDDLTNPSDSRGRRTEWRRSNPAPHPRTCMQRPLQLLLRGARHSEARQRRCEWKDPLAA